MRLTRAELIEVPDCRVVGTKQAWEANAAGLMKGLPEVSAMIAVVLALIPGKEVRTG